MTAKDHSPKVLNFGTASAIFISILALFASFWQACLMRTAMRVDQRAWVSISRLVQKSLTGGGGDDAGKWVGAYEVQMSNSGKTPAIKFYACGWSQVNSSVEPDLSHDRCKDFTQAKADTASYSPLFPNVPPYALPIRTAGISGPDVTEITRRKRFIFLIGNRLV
jgi:hypothetical protein